MWEFPGGQVGKIAAFIAMDQVQSLVGELRSWKTQGGQKRKEKERKIPVSIGETEILQTQGCPKKEKKKDICLHKEQSSKKK